MWRKWRRTYAKVCNLCPKEWNLAVVGLSWGQQQPRAGIGGADLKNQARRNRQKMGKQAQYWPVYSVVWQRLFGVV